jgi:hypothetical protein
MIVIISEYLSSTISTCLALYLDKGFFVLMLWTSVQSLPLSVGQVIKTKRDQFALGRHDVNTTIFDPVQGDVPDILKGHG